MKIVNINDSHLDDLGRIVGRTWNFEKYGLSPKENQLFSILDVYDSLIRSNYSKVALIDNEPVGFIIGRNFKKPKDDKWTYLKVVGGPSLYELKESPRYKLMNDFSEMYKRVNNALKDKIRDRKFDSELVFFAVDPDYKGKGVGSLLLDDFYQFLNDNKLTSLYVYTDTNCDFDFYEKNDFKRLGKITEKPPLMDNDELEFYIYSKKL